jgi:putative cell wall-binding protein
VTLLPNSVNKKATRYITTYNPTSSDSINWNNDSHASASAHSGWYGYLISKTANPGALPKNGSAYDPNKWQEFDPTLLSDDDVNGVDAEVMSLDKNGLSVAYYARNNQGYGYSNVIKLAVRPVSLYPQISGDNRIITSAQTALDAWPEGCRNAVLAAGDTFQAALAASYLAGALDCPVILVSPSGSSKDTTKSVLKTLGVTHVYVVGGAITAKIRAGVFSGTSTTVSSSKDAATIAVDVVKYVTTTLNRNKPTSVILTTDSNFPDALGVSAYAANARLNIPILFVHGLNSAAKAAAEVKALGTVKTVYALGTPNVTVSSNAAKQVASGHSLKWLYGTDRNGTAAAVFATFSPMVAATNDSGKLNSIGFACGAQFADALGCGPAQAHLGGAIYITPASSLGLAVKAVLDGGSVKVSSGKYTYKDIHHTITNFEFYGQETIAASNRRKISGFVQ